MIGEHVGMGFVYGSSCEKATGGASFVVLEEGWVSLRRQQAFEDAIFQIGATAAGQYCIVALALSLRSTDRAKRK